MKAVLDAYAVIAALVAEGARAEVQPLLKTGVICAPHVAEVVDVCVRIHGNEERTVRERAGWLISGGLEVAALESGLALAAGSLRARHYRWRHCEISQGDCFALTLAKQRQLPIAAALDAERDAVDRCASSPDQREGMLAFLQKHPPVFNRPG